jgi:Ca2+-binding EF-hand superfamily protein
MKYVATLAALGLASAALLAVAAPEGREHRGQGMDRVKQADTNGDGMISRDEAKALPRLLEKFNEIDTNGDNQLSKDELRAFHEKQRAAMRAEHWKKLDTNGDGRISLDEAKANAPRLAERFSQIDANGDGFITPEELQAAHGKHARK